MSTPTFLVAWGPTAWSHPNYRGGEPMSLQRWRLCSRLVSLWPICIFSFLYLLVGLPRRFDVGTEGVFVYNALRILQGDVPYQDFWTIHAPGQFYVLAALFWLFSPSLLVARLWDTLVRALLALVMWATARKLTTEAYALLGWFVVLVWLGDYAFYTYTAFPALFFNSASLLCLIKCLSLSPEQRKQRSLWLLGAGALVGVAVLFRHDFALYAFLAEAIVLAAFFWQSLPRRMSFSQRLWAPAKASFPYFLGLAAVALPALAVLLQRVPFKELASDVFWFPLRTYTWVYSTPYPGPFVDPMPWLRGEQPLLVYARQSLDRIPFYFVWVVYGVVALWIWRRRGTTGNPVRFWGVTALGLLGLFSSNHVRTMTGPPHLMPTLLPALLLWAVWMGNEREAAGQQRTRRWILAALLLLSVAARPLISRAQLLTAPSTWQTLTTPRLDQTWPAAAERGRKYQGQMKAVKFIQEHVPPGKPIYVGNVRHDRTRVNDVMFYFLANRPCGTRYHELVPGLTTTAAVQRQMIEDLERNDVRYIVLSSRFERLARRRLPPSFTGSSLLDDWIRLHYRPVEQFDSYEVWQRR